MQVEANITLSIADIPVKIMTKSRKIMSRFYEKRFKPFLAESKPIFELTIKENKQLKDLLPSKSDQFIPSKIDTVEGMIAYTSSDCKGHIDPKNKLARLEIKDESNLPYGIQEFLGVLYSNLLLDNKGILLHSANIIRNKKGYCFFGKSGIGKTTVSRSAIKESKILSDDIVVIRKIKGKYKIFGSCFWGYLGNELKPLNKSAALESLYALKQHKKNILKKLDKNYAMLELISTASFIPPNKERYQKVLDRLDDLTDNVPVYNLHFKKDCSFWSMIK